jgi:hypothetical protein
VWLARHGRAADHVPTQRKRAELIYLTCLQPHFSLRIITLANMSYRQVLSNRYIDREKLRSLLEREFNGQRFNVKVSVAQ